MSFRDGRLQVIDTMFVPRVDPDTEARLRGLVDNRRAVEPCHRWEVQQYSRKPACHACDLSPALHDVKGDKMRSRCVQFDRPTPMPIGVQDVRTLEPFPHGGVGTRPKSAGLQDCYAVWRQ